MISVGYEPHPENHDWIWIVLVAVLIGAMAILAAL
jgi:hypothetical protein